MTVTVSQCYNFGTSSSSHRYKNRIPAYSFGRPTVLTYLLVYIITNVSQVSAFTKQAQYRSTPGRIGKECTLGTVGGAMSNTRKKGTCIRGLPQFTICDWDNLLGYAFFSSVMPSLPPDRTNRPHPTRAYRQGLLQAYYLLTVPSFLVS